MIDAEEVSVDAAYIDYMRTSSIFSVKEEQRTALKVFQWKKCFCSSPHELLSVLVEDSPMKANDDFSYGSV